MREIKREIVAATMRNRAVILEAGCSSGETAYLTDTPDQCYIGLDGNFEFLAGFGRDPRVRLVQARLACNLPLQSGSVDGLYCLGTFVFLDEDEIRRTLSEFRRVGADACTFVFDFHTRWTMDSILFGRRPWRDDARFPYRFIARQRIRPLLEDAGFVIDSWHFQKLLSYWLLTRAPWLTNLDLAAAKACPRLAHQVIVVCHKQSACAEH